MVIIESHMFWIGRPVELGESIVYLTIIELNWIEDEVTVYISSVAHNEMLSEVTKWE